jgi:phosphatidylinositol alpha 1,6-mannosyltransferase
MRIAFFSETFLPKIDGIVVNLTHLLEHLQKRGHKTIVFAPQWENSPKEYAGAQVITVPAYSLPFYPELRLAQPWGDPEDKLKAFKPDLVHLVNPTSLCIAGLGTANNLNLPVVASYHTDMSGFARDWHMGFTGGTIHRYYRWIHNQCDLNLTPSEFTKKELEELGYKRLEVWKGAVDIERFSPAKRSQAWRERLMDGETDKTLVVSVSRLSKEKRPDWLYSLIKNTEGIRLAIVGDGPFRSDLEELFKGTPTVFTGYLTGDDLGAAYAAGDVFVFNGKHETFGNVVLEAMAAGLPAVVPDTGGVVDSVRPGYNGFQYPSDDQNAMIEAAQRLIIDPQTARKMGKNGRVLAENRTWEITLDEVLGFYEQVLENRGSKESDYASRLLNTYKIRPIKRLRKAIKRHGR